MIRCACGAVCLLPLVGCAPSQIDSADNPPRVVITASGLRVDAIAGRTAVLEWTDALGELNERSAAFLSDGTPLTMSLRRIIVQPATLGPSESGGGAWLGNPGVWSSIAVADRTDAMNGTPLVFIDLPDHGGGKDILVNDRVIQVNWIPRPIELPRVIQSVEVDPWKPLMSFVAGDQQRAFLKDVIASEARSPLTRWRHRLIMDGLNPDLSGAEPFADPAIEAIAAANENRWQAALARVWSVDQDTQRRLKRSLGAIVEFGGRAVPAWSTDSASLDSLLSSLLDSRTGAAEVKQVAERWINEGPRFISWVADVGGVLDASRSPVAICGIANLEDKTVIGFGSRNDARTSPDLQPIRPWTAIELAIPLAPIENEIGQLTFPSFITIHAGRESVERPVLSVRWPLTPPRLELDRNFFPDWSLETWRNGQEFSMRAEWLTTGALYKAAEGEKSWELLVMCGRVPGIGSEDNECVRIFTGAPDRSGHVLCVRPDGTVRDERSPSELADFGKVHVVRTPTRWTFKIRIPESDIESDGTLRLGITRTDAAMRRTSWPGPSFPWQTSPPRAALDTGAWKQ
jgi:hypothetical protein